VKESFGNRNIVAAKTTAKFVIFSTNIKLTNGSQSSGYFPEAGLSNKKLENSTNFLRHRIRINL
jgi:hypothetical protein